MGYKPEDPNELEHVRRLAGVYHAHGSKLQVRAPRGLGYEGRWVNVPLEREQLVADTHTCIGHAG